MIDENDNKLFPIYDVELDWLIYKYTLLNQQTELTNWQ